MQPTAVGNTGCSECAIPNADSSSTQLSQSTESITCTVHGMLYIYFGDVCLFLASFVMIIASKELVTTCSGKANPATRPVGKNLY